ncbi:MAG: winged helix-turn-helix domain-containing protein [Chloroflexi bacterium]|nr:winged helix-turn-helix domain-containing protein [Chloroflexota bacterium]
MKSVPSPESLFHTLKAENEPWLDDVFVFLPAFERLREAHSTILYGEIGGGKTATRLALTKQENAGVFTALWMPEPILKNPATGTGLAHQAMRQALSACVESLILEGNLPERLGEPSSHIASALQWFLRNCLPFDAEFYVQSQADRMMQEETLWYSKLLGQSLPSVITEQISLKDQIRLLLMILKAAKYERLWLMVDGLERWISHQAGEQVEALVDAILSTLVIFDVPGVAFKFFLPASLKDILNGTSGVERHRAEEILLEWSAEDLQAMLEKRLAYALSKKASLDSLCDGNEFLNWLKEFGGDSPREWLRFTAPLIDEYQKRGRRLTVAQMHDFILQHPAPLRLDRARREVWLGKKRISIGSATEFRVLEYLSIHPGRICSLEELYYYAYKELDTVPDQGETHWVHKDTWRGAMDMVISRLRKKIEPTPEGQFYLVTHHGKGLELLHAEA